MSCCVRECPSSRWKKKVSHFQFPLTTSIADKWIKTLCLSPEVEVNKLRICSIHFKKEDFQLTSNDSNTTRGVRKKKLKRKRLLAQAIPSLYLGRRAFENDNDAIQEDTDCIRDLEDLKSKFLFSNLRQDFLLSNDPRDCTLWFLYTQFNSNDAPKIFFSIKVQTNLTFSVFYGDTAIPVKKFSSVMKISTSLALFSDFFNLLSHLMSSIFLCSPIDTVVNTLSLYSQIGNVETPSKRKLDFLIEQLTLVEKSKKGPNNGYSPSLIATAFLWKAYSTACYKAILKDGLITLPSVRTLRKIASRASEFTANTQKYLKIKCEKLSEQEKYVILILDEIYVFQNVDYQNGKFTGLVTSSNEVATTVLCFMVKSISAQYCDVIAMIPLRGINVNIVRENCHLALDLLMKSGLHVVAIVCDNHPVNRSFFCQLSGGNPNLPINNPVDPQSKLFLLFDPTHGIKNIYNNFQKAREFRYVAEGIQKPSFQHVRQLYEIEEKKALRMAHKLNKITIAPTGMQRTSAKLAMSVFHDSTIAALEFYSQNGHPEFLDTFNFIKLISDLIKIVNVKSAFVGYRRNDSLKYPFTSTDDSRLSQLDQYAELFENWKKSKLPGLSHETNFAVVNMCRSVKNIVVHLLTECNFDVVLPGYFQSDPLEARFGHYRQMSGGNYFISVKQLMESEKKIKLVSLLKHSEISVDDLVIYDAEHHDTIKNAEIDALVEAINEHMEICEFINLEVDELQVIYYVAGYCAKRARKEKCKECQGLFLARYFVPDVNGSSEFFELINRGKLQAPSDSLFLILCHSYEFFCKLKTWPDFHHFLSSSYSLHIFIDFSMRYSVDIYDTLFCPLGHNCQKLLSQMVTSFYNTLSRNHVRSVNNGSTSKSDPLKLRKLSSRGK